MSPQALRRTLVDVTNRFVWSTWVATAARPHVPILSNSSLNSDPESSPSPKTKTGCWLAYPTVTMHILEPHLFTVALLLLLPATSNGADVSQCYFPNGKASPGDVPCDPSGKTPSMCCRQRSDCLSSGFCLWNATNATSGINLSRGSCTDQSWESPFCPQQCLISEFSFPLSPSPFSPFLVVEGCRLAGREAKRPTNLRV